MKIAVIGCGNMGHRRLDILQQIGGHELLLYDSRVNCTVAVKLSDVWDWHPRIVLICTPPDSHIALLEEAYQNGVRAMFIEKPLCDYSTKGLPALLDCVTMVGCNWRFHPEPADLKKRIDSNDIGQVLFARFEVGYPLDDRDSYVVRVGAALDIGSHLVDLALDWFGPGILTGAVVRDASCLGLPEMDGLGDLQVLHSLGVVSSINVNLIQRHYSHHITVVGRDGEIGYNIALEDTHSQLPGAMFRSELEHFLACVRENVPTCNPIDRAIDVHTILLQARSRWRAL